MFELKIKACYFDAIINGKKLFELRKDDRNYKVGDLIHFNVIEDSYCSVFQIFEITYILKDVPDYGLLPGFVILGIKPLLK